MLKLNEQQLLGVWVASYAQSRKNRNTLDPVLAIITGNGSESQEEVRRPTYLSKGIRKQVGLVLNPLASQQQ